MLPGESLTRKRSDLLKIVPTTPPRAPHQEQVEKMVESKFMRSRILEQNDEGGKTQTNRGRVGSVKPSTSCSSSITFIHTPLARRVRSTTAFHRGVARRGAAGGMDTAERVALRPEGLLANEQTAAPTEEIPPPFLLFLPSTDFEAEV